MSQTIQNQKSRDHDAKIIMRYSLPCSPLFAESLLALAMPWALWLFLAIASGILGRLRQPCARTRYVLALQATAFTFMPSTALTHFPKCWSSSPWLQQVPVKTSSKASLAPGRLEWRWWILWLFRYSSSRGIFDYTQRSQSTLHSRLTSSRQPKL